MLVYWGIFLILSTGALLNNEETTRANWLSFLILASIPTALMIGLRWEIGPDWGAYVLIFKGTSLFTLKQAITHVEPGYYTLNWALNRFGVPFWCLNAICGTVFVAGLTAFSRRQPNPWLAFLVAFPYVVIVLAMSGNRQSLALGFLFFAFNSFEDRKIYACIMYATIAALFHGSVLLLIPILLLSYKTTNSLHKLILLLIAAILGYYFFQDVFHIYARRYSSEKIQSSGVAYRLAMNAFSALLFLGFQRRFGLAEHQIRLWRNIALCTLALAGLVMIVPSSTAIDRFLLYLFPLQFVVLSRLPRALSGNHRTGGQLTPLIIGYAGLVQFTFLYFGVFATYYLPYRTIFQR